MKTAAAAILVVVLCGLILVGSPAAAQGPQGEVTPNFTPTPTITPTPHYDFVIPILEVPIILPTAFQLPPKTPIYVNYTPAPNLNPYGLQTDQFALHIIAEMLNLQQATLDVMGVVGWILDFIITVFLLMGSLAALSKLFRTGFLGFVARSDERWVARTGYSSRRVGSGMSTKRPLSDSPHSKRKK